MEDSTKTTTLFIDPPSGWRYGFPKQAPANLRTMSPESLNEWLFQNGYPNEEIDIWRKNPKYIGVPCRFIESQT